MQSLKTFVLLGATALLLCATWARADSMFGGSSVVSAGSPFGGGTNKYCLFNDNGTFGQDPGCQYDKAIDKLTLAGSVDVPTVVTDTITPRTANVTLSSGQLIMPNGTDVAPFLSSPHNTQTGFFSIAGGVWGFSSGGTSIFRYGSTIDLANFVSLRWSSTSNPSDTTDLSLFHDNAATLQLGVDAASATAQTLKSHDITSGATNTNAPDMKLSSGKSTGTGTGRVVLQAAPAGASGTAQNTPVDVAYVKPGGIDLASGKTFSLNTVVQQFPKTFTATYDPASLAAGTASCDNVTVTGITTTGGAVTANIGAVDPATGCVMSSVRASAADTVRVCWMNAIDAATACDTASSTWTFTQAQ